MSQHGQLEAIEAELIRSLFEAPIPVAIMSAGFIAAGGLTVWNSADPILIVLLIAGAIASLLRLTVIALYKSEAARPGLPIGRARMIQRRFAITYFGFAGILGAFAYRAMQQPSAAIHMLIVCMVVGYAAGAATNVGLRPRIAVPSMLVAVAPAVGGALAHPDPVYWTTGLLAAAFLVGGIGSVTARHARAARSIGRRIAFSALARQDGLTTLPNRLAMREWFDSHVVCARKPGMVAVHYLDLNGFKPVNDEFGHPIGDALLVAVSQRIGNTIRAGDMAARFGGDEFAVIQCGIEHADEAALLAQRLATAIARPYRIEDNTITISSSVGYVISDEGLEDLEYLLSGADAALYASKRSGGGVSRWSPTCPVSDHRAAA